jgi:uncharacterized phiE125 gp8 family phage protein
MFGLKLITPPAVEPITLAQAKLFLRVDIADDDTLITGFITAARQYAERCTGRVFFNQTWQLSLDHFPYFNGSSTLPSRMREDWLVYSALYDQITIRLPKPSCVAVNSITYVDQSNTVQTLSPAAYCADLNSEPSRIVPSPGTYWPYTQSYIPGSVVINYTAGSYGDGVTVNNCPQTLISAMLLLVGHWYANRSAVQEGSFMNLPLAVDALLDTERIDVFTFGDN